MIKIEQRKLINFINNSYIASILISIIIQIPIKFIFYDSLQDDTIEMRVTKLFIILGVWLLCFIACSFITSIITVKHMKKHYSINQTKF